MRNEERENLATFGFVHECYKMLKLKDVQIMPFYLIQLIGKWVRYETIHLIATDVNEENKKHWTIGVDKILQWLILSQWFSVSLSVIEALELPVASLKSLFGIGDARNYFKIPC